MNKKRVIVTVLALDIAFLIGGVSLTAAWYGSGSHLRVTNIEISLRTPEELKIGVNDHDLVTELTTANGLTKVEQYSPVSSMFSASWLDEKKTLPEFRSEYTTANINFPTTYKDSSRATSGFFRQELYLYCDMNVYVTLDKDSLIFKEDNEKNLEKAEQYVLDHPGANKDEVLANLNSVKDSLRLSILDPNEDNYNYYIVDPYKNSDTYLCGALDVNNDSYFDPYFANNDSYEFIYGEYSNEDKVIYDPISVADTEIVGTRSIFNAKTKANTHHFNLEESINNGFTPAIENSLGLNEVENGITIPLYAKTPRKIVVSMYLEGWDKDNIDLASNGSFISSFQFKIKKDMIL